MTLANFFSDFEEQTLPAGTTVVRQGDSCLNYFYVTEGVVKVFSRSLAGKEVILYQIQPGELCVLTTSCLIGDQRFPAEAQAVTALKARAMPKRTFDHLMKTSEDFRGLIFGSFSLRVGSLIQTIEKLALETIEQRLAKYLLLQPANKITVTHQQIAADIGTAREVVSRHLKRMEEDGIVALARGYIEVIDRKLLHKMI